MLGERSSWRKCAGGVKNGGRVSPERWCAMSGDNSLGDWAQAFASFHDRHRGADGKKLKFTGVFNTHMEAFIMEPEVPLDWRVLAAIWRYSWGNNSDFAIQKIGGNRIGQQDLADMLVTDKRRISDAVVLLRALNYVKPDTGHLLYPIDNPAIPSQEQAPHSPG